ncbi:hypothetical protein Q9966_010270 [Columba livia]|nr:hypothetical protein Q9966_010270 [Columba livia]
MLKLTAAAAQESIELQKEADELEMKINYLKKTFEETTEDQSNSDIIEGKNQKSLEKPKEFKERKVSYSPVVINDVNKTSKNSIEVVLGIMLLKYRLVIPPKQTTSNQQFENENAVIANQEAKSGDKEVEDEPKDSSYIPQIEEGYSVGNLNPLSPQKDIGSLFGKSESEDAFAFPFPSESTSPAFGDGKDDFSFPFAFGQDQRSSQSPSVKGFSELDSSAVRQICSTGVHSSVCFITSRHSGAALLHVRQRKDTAGNSVTPVSLLMKSQDPESITQPDVMLVTACAIRCGAE